MILGISGLIFASLCYYIEMEEDSGFTSIPTGFYWVVITMTTVGFVVIADILLFLLHYFLILLLLPAFSFLDN